MLWFMFRAAPRIRGVGCGIRAASPEEAILSQRSFAMWTKPEYSEMRFGFEVTMYIANR